MPGLLVTGKRFEGIRRGNFKGPEIREEWSLARQTLQDQGNKFLISQAPITRLHGVGFHKNGVIKHSTAKTSRLALCPYFQSLRLCHVSRSVSRPGRFIPGERTPAVQ